MARTVQIERRQRGIFGYIFLFIFVASQFLMLFSCIEGVSNVAQQGKSLSDDMKSAHDVGAGIGIMLLMFMWAAVTVVFGGLAFATRGRKIIETIES